MNELRSIGGAYNGLASKVKFIKGCFRKSLMDPRIRRRAEEWAGRGSRAEQVRNLYAALKSGTVYMSDPVGVELTKSPSVMMDQMESSYSHTIKGDCDDLACLAYTMLQSVGIPSSLRVAWYPGSSQPRHIYVMAQPPLSDPIAFDLTLKDRPFGYEHPYVKVMDF